VTWVGAIGVNAVLFAKLCEHLELLGRKFSIELRTGHTPWCVFSTKSRTSAYIMQ
jgi:hypothetical protein